MRDQLQYAVDAGLNLRLDELGHLRPHLHQRGLVDGGGDLDGLHVGGALAVLAVLLALLQQHLALFDLDLRIFGRRAIGGEQFFLVLHPRRIQRPADDRLRVHPRRAHELHHELRLRIRCMSVAMFGSDTGTTSMSPSA
jgi:hypothetical protein